MASNDPELIEQVDLPQLTCSCRPFRCLQRAVGLASCSRLVVLNVNLKDLRHPCTSYSINFMMVVDRLYSSTTNFSLRQDPGVTLYCTLEIGLPDLDVVRYRFL